MMDEDKTREQLIAELTQLRKRVAGLDVSGDGVQPDALLRAVHRSPAVTIVWRASDGWPVSFVSEGVRRYGYIPQDLMGLAHHERYVAAEDLPSFIATFVEAAAAPNTRSFTREYRLITRTGETRWVRERLWVERDAAGVVTHLAGSLYDIQDLRQLEAEVHEQKQRLAALFEDATQPILFHDPAGRCIDANAAACDYLGYAPDELRQVPLDAILSPEVAARIQRLALGGPESRGAVLEGVLVGRDGDRLPAVLECRVIELNGHRAIVTHVHTNGCLGAPSVTAPASTEALDALQSRIEELEGANRCLQQERDALTAQLAEHAERIRGFEVLLRDVHHRVKNNLQVIASLLGLQAEYIQDQRALDAFAESQSRVRAMALVHERVYQSNDLARVDLGAYVRDLAERMFVAMGTDPSVNLKVDVEPISLPMDTAIPCGLLISELVSNSIKHAFPNGRGGTLDVAAHRDGDRVVLTVGDDGVGLPEGLDYRQTESLGLQLVSILADQLGAVVDVNTSHGARFTVSFHTEA